LLLASVRFTVSIMFGFGTHRQAANDDPFDLNRFVEAQAGMYDRALAELKRGDKRSHWMWFIFPQIDGLGHSSTAQFFAIKSVDEAKAYLTHAVLGPRLIECSTVLLQLKGLSASDVFGFPDDLKLRSSMTLFASVSEPDSAFSRVLQQYYQGQPDEKTLELLKHGR
jgi:uncharacterized protein (DUF1810 family)